MQPLPPMSAPLRISRIYAEALMAAAQQKGETDRVLEELDSLVDDVFKNHPQLETLFSSAALGRYARRDALNKAFDNRCSETFLSFLHILNEHDRLDLLRSIRQAVHELDDERKNRVQVLVQSAVPLSDNIRHALAEQIRSVFQKEPVLVARIAPELLGGMKIRIGDVQVDSTVRNYLDNMKKNILARSSHEIQSRRDSFSSTEEIEQFRSRLDIREVGRVLEVGDGIARVYGLSGVMAGEMVEFVRTGVRGLAFNLEENSVGVIILGDYLEITRGR